MLAGRRWLVLVFFVVLVVRGVVAGLAVTGDGPLGWLGGDPDAYRLIAETLATTGTFGIPVVGNGVDPTAFRPPLYPWLLSWLAFEAGGPGGEPWQRLSLVAVAVLHSVLGAITAVATMLAVNAWQASFRFQHQQKSSRIGVVAGLLVAIDPLLLMQSTLVMTETLATAIAAVTWAMLAGMAGPEQLGPEQLGFGRQVSSGRAAVWWLVGRWLVVGGLLALGYLCRPTFIVWTLGIVMWLGMRVVFGRGDRWRNCTGAVLILVITGLTMAGWMARNARVIGKPVWATTHGGYTLLLGNNPYFYEFLRERTLVSASLWGEAWDADPFHREWRVRQGRLELDGAGDRELLEDAMAGAWAKKTISEQPWMLVYASLVRVVRLWSPVPRVGSRVTMISLVLGIYYGCLYLACAVAVVRLGRRLMGPAGVSALMLVASLTVVHAVYWSNVRMRSPAIPVVVGLAALSLAGGSLAGGSRLVGGDSGSPLGLGEH